MHYVWIDNNRLDLYLYSWGYTKLKKIDNVIMPQELRR